MLLCTTITDHGDRVSETHIVEYQGGRFMVRYTERPTPTHRVYVLTRRGDRLEISGPTATAVLQTLGK